MIVALLCCYVARCVRCLCGVACLCCVVVLLRCLVLPCHVLLLCLALCCLLCLVFPWCVALGVACDWFGAVVMPCVLSCGACVCLVLLVVDVWLI